MKSGEMYRDMRDYIKLVNLAEYEACQNITIKPFAYCPSKEIKGMGV